MPCPLWLKHNPTDLYVPTNPKILTTSNITHSGEPYL